MRLATVHTHVELPCSSGRDYMYTCNALHTIPRFSFAAPINPTLRRRLEPLGVTNEGRELRFRGRDKPEEPETPEFIEIEHAQYINIKGKKKPLQRTVHLTFEEGLISDEVDSNAENWWFNEPDEGWKTGKKRVRVAKEAKEVEFNYNPRHDDFEDGYNERRPLSDMKPGDILTGKVVRMMVRHGYQLDCGSTCDALIPIEMSTRTEERNKAWKPKQGRPPSIGDVIEVRVHAVRNHSAIRWPLQVTPTDPDIAAAFPDPTRYTPSLDLRNVSWEDMPVIMAIAGREWKPVEVELKVKERPEPGVDEEGGFVGGPLTDVQLQAFDDAVMDTY